MIARRVRGDDGVSLILALVFLSLMGIFVASALSLGAVSFKNTTVTRSRADQLYAADGGVEHAIQQLHADVDLCPEESPVVTELGTTTLNGREVTLTCQTTAGGLTTTSGSPLLGDYVAVIGSGGVAVTGGGWGPAEIHGSLSSGGSMSIQWSDPDQICALGYAPLVFEYFELEPQHDPLECAWIDVEGNLAVTEACPPAKVYVTESCSSSLPPPPEVPTVRIPPNASTTLAPKTVGGCTILYPGRYTNSNPINTSNFFNESKQYYLASGTYYFSGSNEVKLKGQIFGGSPSPEAPWEDTQLMGGGATPCATDATAQAQSGTLPNGQPRYNAATAGTGVTVVRGSGRLRAEHSNTKIELYTRVPGSADAGATPGVTFWANTSPTEGIAPGSGTYIPVPDDTEIFVNAEPEIDVVIHGLSYMAKSRANLREPFNHQVGSGQGAVSFFLGGVVARQLTITRAYDENVQRISIAGTGEGTESFDPRTTTVTATAQSTSGGAPTTVTAVVEPDVTPPRIVTWRQG